MSENANGIEKLATESFKVLANTMFSEITGAIDKFATLAEKGTVIFLQSVGGALVVLSICLTWHSETVYERLTNRMIDKPVPESHVIGSMNKEAYSPYSPQQSSNIELKGVAVPPLRVQFGPMQLFTLSASGTLLMLAGSFVSVITYKWRLDSYRIAQTIDKETLALQVSLRQSGIRAIAESQKEIAVVATAPLAAADPKDKRGDLPIFESKPSTKS